MKLAGKKIGLGITGSHCTYDKVIPQIEKLKQEGAEVQIILSEAAQNTDTRFGKASEWKERLSELSEHKLITTITEAEPIGPLCMFDCLVIAPCTGNTIGKLANSITDGPVLMAAKAHLRNTKPLVIGISTNDGLSNNAKNIGVLLNAKNFYFIPFAQDDPIKKPNSIVANMNLIFETVLAAIEGKQIQPVLDR
ncbi:MAG: dipicolinate synthase subunit B [Peptococcaceae bacterium]